LIPFLEHQCQRQQETEFAPCFLFDNGVYGLSDGKFYEKRKKQMDGNSAETEPDLVKRPCFSAVIMEQHRSLSV
jgi:hypothetical protein